MRSPIAIRLVLDARPDTACAERQVFTITIDNDGVAEIRRSGSPGVTRDTSIDSTIGWEPSVTDVRLSVEVVPL